MWRNPVPKMAATFSLRIYNTLPRSFDYIPTTWIHPESWLDTPRFLKCAPQFHWKKLDIVLVLLSGGFWYRWLDAHVCIHPVHLEMPSLAVKSHHRSMTPPWFFQAARGIRKKICTCHWHPGVKRWHLKYIISALGPQNHRKMKGFTPQNMGYNL